MATPPPPALLGELLMLDPKEDGSVQVGTVIRSQAWRPESRCPGGYAMTISGQEGARQALNRYEAHHHRRSHHR